MISLSSEPTIPFSSDPAGAQSPVKQAQLSIDLNDFLSSNTTTTPSSLSVYDSTSSKGDEENIKPFEALSRKSPKVLAVNICPFERNLTLKDIISKRTYSRKPKEAKNLNKGTSEKSGKRRRKQTENGLESEEVMIKKEKTERIINQNQTFQPKNEVNVPQVIIKEGKVLVSGLMQEKEMDKPSQLQVVQLNRQKVTMSTSFKQMNHTEKWTEKETEKFYRALELFGTDFSMIAKVFQNRNRSQIKNKFLREERMATEKINNALKGTTKSTHFNTILHKYKLNKIEKADENVKHEHFPKNSHVEKIEGSLVVQNRVRSESICSTTSLNSVDVAIIDDLADILFPQKQLLRS